MPLHVTYNYFFYSRAYSFIILSSYKVKMHELWPYGHEKAKKESKHQYERCDKTLITNKRKQKITDQYDKKVLGLTDNGLGGKTNRGALITCLQSKLGVYYFVYLKFN